MTSKLSKFCPRIAASVALFIFLSVSQAEERTRCYWCGPLAEQVHRSQRAPSCHIFDLEQHETLCDRGYTYCAIVAVSPPYAESRLCVKLYQDECYSLYCNSTKTWRVVCACRGDLCNGPRTDRELHAFALLPKFTKTKPRKRNLISHFNSVKTKTPIDDDTIIIMSKNNQTINGIQSDQPIIQNENMSKLYTPTPTRTDDTIIIVHGTLNDDKGIDHDSLSKIENNNESNMHSMEPTMLAVEDKYLDNTKPNELDNSKVHNVDNAETNKNLGNAELDENMGNSEVGKHLDEAQVEKHVNKSDVDKDISKAEKTKLNNAEIDKSSVETTSAVEIVTENQESTTTASMSIKPTVEIAVPIQTSAAPGKMPSAESLQENVTPTKAMELTTIVTVAMNTENLITETTVPRETKNSNKKNDGRQNLALVIVLFISFLVHCCL